MMSAHYTEKRGRRTPWGTADSETKIADGVTWYSTPSHGGYYLTPKLNALIPEGLRTDGDRAAGWYEEDCDWALVVTCFPSLFTPEVRAEADRCFKSWQPAEYEKFHGVTLKEGDSYKRDEEIFAERNAHKWVGVSAIGIDFTGYVRVAAQLGGRRQYRRGDTPGAERWFIVPKAEYDERSQFGFVIDPLEDYYEEEVDADECIGRELSLEALENVEAFYKKRKARKALEASGIEHCNY